MTTVSFPGLGIGEFSFDPVAFELPIFGGLEVHWYGIIIVTGIILAFIYATFKAKYEGVSFDHLLDITIFTVVFAVIGARLYYVLTSLDQYDSFLEMISIWNGGIAIYGAIIAGAITVYAVCKYKKISYLKMFDAAAPAVMIGQIIGRWGNFCNGEAFGTVVSESSPLYFLRMGLISNNTGSEMTYVHPTFLYESLWNLVGFILIHFLYKKKKFDGQVVLMYVTWYGFGRMFIEGLRTDSLYIPGTVFRISQVIGFLCFVLGGLALIVLLTKAKRREKDSMEYVPAYKKISNPVGIFTDNANAEYTVANEEDTTAKPDDGEEYTDDINKEKDEE